MAFPWPILTADLLAHILEDAHGKLLGRSEEQ